MLAQYPEHQDGKPTDEKQVDTDGNQVDTDGKRVEDTTDGKRVEDTTDGKKVDTSLQEIFLVENDGNNNDVLNIMTVCHLYVIIIIVHYKRKKVAAGFGSSQSTSPNTFWQIEKHDNTSSGKEVPCT